MITTAQYAPGAAALKMRVLAAARSRPALSRRQRGARTALLVAAAAEVMVAMSLLCGGPPHAAGRPAGAVAWLVMGTLGLALAATRFALPGPRSMLARKPGHLLGVALAVPFALGAWVQLWHSACADSLERFGWRCAGLFLAIAPPPFAVLAYLARRIDPVSPHLTGAALGAAAGAWAAVLVEAWCPLSRCEHVLIGHVSPLLLLAAIGAAVGERLFGVRIIGDSVGASPCSPAVANPL